MGLRFTKYERLLSLPCEGDSARVAKPIGVLTEEQRGAELVVWVAVNQDFAEGMRMQTLWYDGARLPRADVIARVERDLVDFLDEAVRSYLKNNASWSVLLDDVALSSADARPNSAGMIRTAADVCDLTWCSDNLLAIRPSHHTRFSLHAIHAQVASKRWCLSASIEESVDNRLGGRTLALIGHLGPSLCKRIEPRIIESAMKARDELRRGNRAFHEIIFPDVLRDADALLEHALSAIDVAETAKRTRLREFL